MNGMMFWVVRLALRRMERYESTIETGYTPNAQHAAICEMMVDGSGSGHAVCEVV